MTRSSRIAKHSNDDTGSSSFRTNFSGYYPPTDEELERFVVTGLIVLDTNAVLDLYRFTDATREGYMQALALLGERLWIPNRVGEEFYDRRTTAIRERQGVRDEITVQLEPSLEEIVEIVAFRAQRRGLDGPAIAADLRHGLLDALEPVLHKLEEAVGGIALDPEAHPDSDPILEQICELFDEKVGIAFGEKQLAGVQRDHAIRMSGKIPPGYSDAKKGDRAVGDFLVWKQTLAEAKERKLPVLLITNEKKEDWVLRDGEYAGPRPELVREMKQEAGCAFHLVDVQTFLALAKEHLAADISEAAVDEASRVSDTTAEAAWSTYRHGVRDAAIRAVMGNVDPSAFMGARDAATRAVMGNVDPRVLGSVDTDGIYRAAAGLDPLPGTQEEGEE